MLRQSLLVSACLFVLFSPVFGQQKTCTVVPANAPVSPAEQAFRVADFKKSYDLFIEAYNTKRDEEQLDGAVRAALMADDNAAAYKLMAAHVPVTSWGMLAQARVELSKGHVEQSAQSAMASVKADICNAQARYFTARLLRLNSMYAAARKQINVAHQLDHSDPYIQHSWLYLQPAQERLAEFKKEAADTSVSGEQKKLAEMRVQYLEDKISGKGHSCHVVNAAPTMTTNMTPIMEDGQTIGAWGLTVAINGHPTIVELDTGASGLIINRGAAEKAGLKPLDHVEAMGVGGKTRFSLAYASSIKVGDYEFADCVVQIDEHYSIGGHGMGPQGLIGTDVFERKLVTLDFPMRKLTLSPLPGPASQSPTEADTEGGDDDVELGDRYTGPEMKDYMQVYRDDHVLMVPMLLNGKEELMWIDTGADNTHFNLEAASEFTKASLDSSYVTYGVGGKEKKTYTTGEVQMRLPNGMTQFQNGATATDMHNFGDIRMAGLLGSSFLYNNVVDIDYRDGMVRMTYDRKRGHNAMVR